MVGLLILFIRAYEIVLLVRIILSWVPHDPYTPAVRWLERVTDPVLEPARRIIPPISGLDISPVLVFLALEFVQRVLIRAL
jgi:YggT family protein